MHAKQVLDERRAVLSKDAAAQDGGIGNWTWLGPSNIGGRVRALVRHPTDFDILWAGSAGGGIWKTTNGGSSWSHASDFLASLAVSSMAIDPNNPNVLYASTGEGFGNQDALPGVGVFKSTDGGSTWTHLAATAEFTWTTRLAHDPTSSNVLFVSTTDKLYGTINGGTTWSEVYNPVGDIRDVKISPWNANLMAVAGDRLVHLSTNGGRSFSSVSPSASGVTINGRIEVAFGRDGSTDYIYALADTFTDPTPDDEDDDTAAAIFRSSNLGSSWTLMNNSELVFNTQSWYDNVIWVDPTNYNRIIIGGVDLWRSIDGGANLTKISDWRAFSSSDPGFSAHADQHVIVTNAVFDGTNNKTLYVGNDGGVQKILDFTTVSEHSGWVNLSPGLGITQFYKGAASPGGGTILGGSQDNSFLQWSGGGAGSWDHDVTGDGGFVAVDPFNTQNLYASIQFLWLYRSTDGGQTWQEIMDGLDDAKDKDKSAFIAPYTIMPASPTTLFACGEDIWKSTDTGDNWAISYNATNVSPCTAVAASGSSTVWFGREGGGLIKTTNAGSSWDIVDGPLFGARFVTDIDIDDFNVNHVVLTYGGYEEDTIWETTNGGDTWTQIRGTEPYNIPAIHISAVSFHPLTSDWIYVGTDLGILATEDGGATWSQDPRFSTGNEGPVNTEVADIFWHGNEWLVAATHGRGMYRARPMITAYVDASNASAGDGSVSSPYQSLVNAEAGTGHGTTFIVAGGTYGPVTIEKRHEIVTTGQVLIE